MNYFIYPIEILNGKLYIACFYLEGDLVEINKYRLFLKIAEFNNITSAAKSMNYTQSTASYAISSLEEELGIKLLQRTNSGTCLTADGSYLLPSIREVVEKEDTVRMLVDSINTMHKGDLKIGAFTSAATVCLPRIISRFHELYPNIRIEIFSGDGSYSDLEHALLTGLVDCIFICGPTSPDLKSVDLFRDPLRAVLPPDHPFSRQDGPITFKQLEEIPFLMPPKGNNTDILHLCETYDFHPNVAFTLPDDFSLLAMAENGLGCTILPNLILSHYRHNAVIKEIAEQVSRTVSFAVRAKDISHPRINALLSITQSLLGSFGVEEIE